MKYSLVRVLNYHCVSKVPSITRTVLLSDVTNTVTDNFDLGLECEVFLFLCRWSFVSAAATWTLLFQLPQKYVELLWLPPAPALAAIFVVETNSPMKGWSTGCTWVLLHSAIGQLLCCVGEDLQRQKLHSMRSVDHVCYGVTLPKF